MFLKNVFFDQKNVPFVFEAQIIDISMFYFVFEQSIFISLDIFLNCRNR